jgi:aquaglyceroporin related protein
MVIGNFDAGDMEGFPRAKSPWHIVAQVLGGLVGNYFHVINIVEDGSGIRTMKTAGLFGTYVVCRVINGKQLQT